MIELIRIYENISNLETLTDFDVEEIDAGDQRTSDAQKDFLQGTSSLLLLGFVIVVSFY